MSKTAHSKIDGFQKPATNAIVRKVRTPLGNLVIRGPLESAELDQYRFEDGLNCFRPASKQHQALVRLAGEPDGVIFIAAMANIVVSYISFQKPDFPWWEKRYFAQLIELGGIETAPSWRRMGLTKIFLDTLFKNPDFKYFEDYIVIAIQSVHGWDLKNTGLAPWQYRHFMVKLFKNWRFATWETEDPEVREHPCNFLLARVGKNVDLNLVNHFAGCCMETV